MNLDPNREIDPQEWREVTIRSDMKETYDLPRAKPNKWVELFWIVAGIAAMFVIGGIVGSGWL